MRNIFRYLLLMVFVCTLSKIQAQQLAWARQATLSGAFIQVGWMSVDDNGNVYTSGSFNGTVDMDPGPGVFNLTSSSQDVFVVKHNSSGNLVWAKKIGGPGLDANYCNALDKAGNLYLTGDFENTVDFDSGAGVSNLTSFGGRDFYVLKLDTSGNFIWVKQIGSPAVNETGVPMVSVNSQGNLVLAFTCFDAADFDPGPGTFTITGQNLVLFQLSSSGNFMWAKRIDFAVAFRILLNHNDDIFIGGFFHGQKDFDPGTGVANLLGDNQGDGFVARYDASGNYTWAKKIAGPDRTAVYDICLDPVGNVVAAGIFEQNIDMDPGPQLSYAVSKGKTDIFITKLSSAGNYTWGTTIGGTGSDEVLFISMNKRGNLFFTGTFENSVYFNSPAQSAQLTADSTDGYICELTSYGRFASVKQIGGQYRQNPYMVVTDTYDNIYLSGTFQSTVDFDTGPGVYNLTAGGGADMFIAKYASKSYITGSVYLDGNLNGTRNVGESGLFNIIVKASKPGKDYFTVTNREGKYLFEIDTGNYTLSVPTVPYYPTSAPATRNSNISSLYGVVDTGMHFGLQPLAGIKDLKVVLTNLAAVNPGFHTRYRLTYTNVGTTVLSGSVTVKHDSSLVFSSSAGSYTYAYPLLTYGFSNLQPFQQQDVDIVLLTPPTVPLGKKVTFIANINPVTGDTTPLNNVDSLFVIVGGSFDPNDKRVFPAGPVTPAFINNGEYLDYTIRFQNTGTDTARFVTIADTLSSKFDIASLQMISASHDYEMKIAGDNALEWAFKNINLPDSNRNEPASHGFVRYRVKVKPPVSSGDIVKNKAAIYFDFNEPVITNEAGTPIVAILPVAFMSFNGWLTVDNKALLQWKTASEQNSLESVVEHSVDGINFYRVGVVKMAGQSNSMKVYEFLHETPVNGKNYYRIRLVYVDGRTETTNIVTVIVGGHGKLYLQPNPARENVMVNHPVGDNSMLRIIDMKGRLIKSFSVQANIGQSNISLAGIMPGVYTIQWVNKSIVLATKCQVY